MSVATHSRSPGRLAGLHWLLAGFRRSLAPRLLAGPRRSLPSRLLAGPRRSLSSRCFAGLRRSLDPRLLAVTGRLPAAAVGWPLMLAAAALLDVLRPPKLAAALLAGFALALAGCGGMNEEDDGRLRVVTTVGMVTDAVERVGGDRVRVTGLMGPGVDPHLYKASAGDVRTLASADLIFYVGLHLEAAMADVLAEMDGRTRTRAVTDDISRELLLTPPEFDGAYDPHIWSDVRLWMQAIETVAETLAEVDPDGAAGYRERAQAYLAELEVLDAWVREQVERVPPQRRVLVTAHDAFHYLGRAYGFRVVGLQGLSTAVEAGTGDVQRVARLIAEERIPAIFVESSIPRRNVEAVQAAVRSRGFDVAIGGMLYSDAMGDPGTPEGTYVGMIRHNVLTIVDALSGEPG